MNKGSSRNDNHKNEESYQRLIKILCDEKVEIYMPYIEKNQLNQNTITVVAASIGNEGDKVKGYRINLNMSSKGSVAIEPVLVDVDDDYASRYNTLILQPIDIYNPGGTGGGDLGGGTSGGNTGSNTPTEIYDSLYRMHVQIAHMRCATQYDKLVSLTGNAGASEFKFFRAKPEYNFTEDKVEAAAYQVQAELSRKQIRNNSWVHQFVDWDLQWDESEILQGLAIYEWDNTDNKVRIKGNVEMDVTLKLDLDSIEGSTSRKMGASFDLEYSSKHTILLDQDVEREYFYDDINNKTDFGNGFYNDRAVRKAGSLYYTFNVRPYYN